MPVSATNSDRMKRTYRSLLFFLLSMSHWHCKKGVFGNEGGMVVVNRITGSFNQVILYDNINLVLTQDTTERISVEAPRKIEPFITTELIGHTLWIRNTNAGTLINPDENITVHLSVKSLNRFDYHGAGSVRCTNTLQKDYFVVVADEGSGDLQLDLHTIQTLAYLYSDMADFIFTGQSDTCYTYCSSLGTIDYKNFQVKKLGIDYSGIRNAYVSASEVLSGNIFYKGNVYYKGSPYRVTVQTPGEGRLIPY